MKNPDKYNFVQVGSLWLAFPKGRYTFAVATSKTLKFAITTLRVADSRITKRIKS